MNRKRLAIGVVVLALLAGGVYTVLGHGENGVFASQSQVEAAQTEPPVKAGNQVKAEGQVVPAHSAELSLPTSGIVASVLVAEGDRVEAGQVLLKLDSARLEVAVAQAEAGLKRAQARLDELNGGARPQEIEAARAAVAAAQGQIAKITQGARDEEIAAAEASLAAAQANLRKVQEGPDENQIIAAKAEVANTEANVRQAQNMYDLVRWAPDIGSRPEATQLQQATNNHIAAKARLDQLAKEPSEATVASATAQVQQAEAELNRVKAAARPADYAAAQAEVRRAQAQLELLEVGTRPEIIAAAEADVESAKATLDQAKVALAETELKAPFAGVVASLDPVVGEHVAAGTPIARVADPSVWEIQTTDLTELSIANVHEGQTAILAFDAIPGLELSGTVTRVKAIGQNRQGDVNYTVIVKPERQDERLRWNMTALVTIETN